MKITTEIGDILPPYILQYLEIYENGITHGQADRMDPEARWDIMQAFYAGFARAAGLVDALFTTPEITETDRKQVLDLIKQELASFSARNAKHAKEAGFKTVRL